MINQFKSINFLSYYFQTQNDCAAILQPYFSSDGIVIKCLEYAHDLDHVMDFTRLRALSSLFSMLNQGVRNILTYNNTHSDFAMQVSILCADLTKKSWKGLQCLFTCDNVSVSVFFVIHIFPQNFCIQFVKAKYEKVIINIHIAWFIFVNLGKSMWPKIWINTCISLKLTFYCLVF